MPGTIDVQSVTCPRCEAEVEAGEGERARCLSCGWRGRVMRFEPVAVADLETPDQAVGEDITCVHHPNKKAEAICAGTGDYICSLCAIEVGEKTYSAAFVNRGGLKELEAHFDRRLPRPDRLIVQLFLISVFPWTAIAGPFLYPWAIVKYFQFLRLRRESDLFRRVSARSNVVVIPILLIIWGGIYLIFLGFLAFGLFELMTSL